MNDRPPALATAKARTLPGAAEPARPLAVRVADLDHFYGQGDLSKQVLFANQLEVEAGEIVIMTGPSGSGKTTLLSLIGTLRSVQHGSVQVLGHELRGASADEVAQVRRQIGFIFQAHNLFDSLTAAHNVQMAVELFGGSPRENHRRSLAILDRLGLANRATYRPAALSGGQKQRVAIARGLVHGPKLILADEPTAALDEVTGREVVTLFQELARDEECTILIVTHDNRILDVADRIVNMVDGRIKSAVHVQEAAVICQFLQKCAVFAGLTPRTLTAVADRMHVEEYAGGNRVIRQGDAGDKFYLIRYGRVRVEQERDGRTRAVADLGEGDFFGEAALLTGAPRNASVVTLDDAVLYVLGKDDFDAVLAASDSLQDELRKALFERQ